MASATASQIRKIAMSSSPSARIAPSEGEYSTSKRMAGGRIEPGFPAPAQFVETDRGEAARSARSRPQAGMPSGSIEEPERQRSAQAEQRIDHAEEHSVARHCGKIIETASERLIEIRWCNVTNREICGPCAYANEKM
jgi:type IV secretory pathway TrbL component